MVMIIILYCSAQLMTLMMMIPVCSVGHKLPGLNPAPDIAFLPHPLLYNTMPALHNALYNTMMVRIVNIPESTEEQQLLAS